MPYTYERSTDGCDEIFDVLTPEGRAIASFHFWDDEEKYEADAKVICDALNAYNPPLFDAVKAIVTEHDNAMHLNEKQLDNC